MFVKVSDNEIKFNNDSKLTNTATDNIIYLIKNTFYFASRVLNLNLKYNILLCAIYYSKITDYKIRKYSLKANIIIK